MTECAWCATRTKNTFFSARYGRLAARRGKKRALVAIAAEMLKVVYHMLKDGTAYREPGANYMDDRRRQNQIDYYKKKTERTRRGFAREGKCIRSTRTLRPIFTGTSEPEYETGLND